MCFGCLPTSAPKKECNLCLTPGTKQVWAYFLRWYEPTFKYCTFGQHNTPWFDRKPSPRARAAGAERSRTPLLRLDTPGIWNQLSALTSSPVAMTREGLLQPHTHVWLRRCLGYQRKSGDRQTLSPSLITLLTAVVQNAPGTLNFLYKLCVFSHWPARTDRQQLMIIWSFFFQAPRGETTFPHSVFLDRQAVLTEEIDSHSTKHQTGRISTFMMNLYSLSFVNKGLFL